MEWSKRATGIEIGDTVAYSRRFLQSTGQYTGEAPHARGKVTGLSAVAGLVLVEIDWSGADLPARVNAKNLSRVKDGVVLDRD
ncbi:hypothetical protein [Humisphaera borealis]|jgi:hypothetical protein|uniref:Uncharacterized protein n=1 Tax=Humisphaera borealis TaxID=2807512 RepID=A0A7M2X2W0_9BACT|nr:hypothetical protein [Humisphaera borealis]QOV92106.1 hypothetical protein IPV69_12425 [Humisphaera borealis]